VSVRDRERIERVTRQQERLSARLARAESVRLELLSGASLDAAIAKLPVSDVARLESLRDDIASSVRELKQRQDRTAGLLARTLEVGKQTLEFLQRLVVSPGPAYNDRGRIVARHSVLVDGRA
jgi:flagellar biosynthesis/type III secretory pathway chaperone